MSRLVAGVVLALAVVVVLALMIGRFTGSRGESVNEAEGAAETVARTEPEFSPPVTKTGPSSSRQSDSGQAVLTPAEVIDKWGFDCSMERGRSTAADLAIVAVSELVDYTDPVAKFSARNPTSISTIFSARHSTRFSVLDQTGELYAGQLPFRPFQRKLGKRPYGPPVAGFGGINLMPYRTALPAGGEPVRIFMGDTVIYENDHAWLFDVADDGSSYFVIEPLGSDLSSRLVVSNLDQGTEAHHHLGTMLANSEGVLAYLASYTSNNEEVHLRPVTEFTENIGLHYFFQAQGGDPPRTIRVPDRGQYDQALFISSEEMYMFYEAAHRADSLQIVKARFDWDAGTGVSTVWRKEGPLGTAGGAASTTPDGAWLLFATGKASTAKGPVRDRHEMLYLLDAVTGKTAFALPIRNIDAAMQRLSSVLPAQPTEDDVGWYMGASFVGNDKLVVRRLEDTSDRESASFYDVYDLNSISLDAQPAYRVESNQHRWNPCASKGFPGTLQVAESGRLAYVSLQ